MAPEFADGYNVASLWPGANTNRVVAFVESVSLETRACVCTRDVLYFTLLTNQIINRKPCSQLLFLTQFTAGRPFS